MSVRHRALAVATAGAVEAWYHVSSMSTANRGRSLLSKTRPIPLSHSARRARFMRSLMVGQRKPFVCYYHTSPFRGSKSRSKAVRLLCATGLSDKLTMSLTALYRLACASRSLCQDDVWTAMTPQTIGLDVLSSSPGALVQDPQKQPPRCHIIVISAYRLESLARAGLAR